MIVRVAVVVAGSMRVSTVIVDVRVAMRVVMCHQPAFEWDSRFAQS